MSLPDPAALAQTLIDGLRPFLLAAGAEAAKEVGKKSVEWAEKAWAKLRRHPKVAEAARDLAAAPDDPDALAALRLQIKKALQADPELARELAALVAQAGAASIQDRSVRIEGDVKGSVIITGDGNVVSK